LAGLVAAPGVLGNDANLLAGNSDRRLADANHNLANSALASTVLSPTRRRSPFGDDPYN
jgi:hypothetical protein